MKRHSVTARFIRVCSDVIAGRHGDPDTGNAAHATLVALGRRPHPFAVQHGPVEMRGGGGSNLAIRGQFRFMTPTLSSSSQ